MSAKVVRVRCPECGATGKVRKASLNKKKTCPKCKASIVFQAITSSNHTSSRKIKILVLSGCILFALLSGGYFVVGSIREGLQVRQKLEKAAQEEEQKHLAEEKKRLEAEKKAEQERLEAERKKREEERLAAERIKKEEKAKRLEEERRLKEANTTYSVTGESYVETKSRELVVMRNASVYIVQATGALEGVVQKLKRDDGMKREILNRVQRLTEELKQAKNKLDLMEYLKVEPLRKGDQKALEEVRQKEEEQEKIVKGLREAILSDVKKGKELIKSSKTTISVGVPAVIMTAKNEGLTTVSTKTDKDGEFSFEGLHRGKYFIIMEGAYMDKKLYWLIPVEVPCEKLVLTQDNARIF